ncbi:MAG TPA: CorA family divalent cation transporter [Xanthobacteraceae bacterium]|jgi:magnesium transporter|nr:CorA family divalent cation transporter [Xanthobacteraceae bacterium]
MLHTYPLDHGRTALSQCAWVDLVDPSDEERATVEKTFSLRVPTREELSEIEATSRLQIEDGTLYMTAPLILATGSEPWISEPTGFVLAKHVFLTVRSVPSEYFDKVVAQIARHQSFDPAFVFVRILEEVVAHMADLLETTSNDLDEASHVIFRPGRRPKLSRETALLRQLMIRTGRTSERMARAHYTLMCLDRIAKFTQERGREWIAPNLCSDLQGISSDVNSLVQFGEGLVNRVQLLQDAATGIISIDQNEVMKVLTITSVVGIPPVLVAGIYGMNFKGMPEYDWSWGYPYALALIAITALLPLVWFKWKDWI